MEYAMIALNDIEHSSIFFGANKLMLTKKYKGDSQHLANISAKEHSNRIFFSTFLVGHT